MTKKPGLLERLAEKIGLIPDLSKNSGGLKLQSLTEPGDLTSYPPPEKWDDWTEYDAKSWHQKGRAGNKKLRFSGSTAGCFLILKKKKNGAAAAF